MTPHKQTNLHVTEIQLKGNSKPDCDCDSLINEIKSTTLTWRVYIDANNNKYTCEKAHQLTPTSDTFNFVILLIKIAVSSRKFQVRIFTIVL